MNVITRRFGWILRKAGQRLSWVLSIRFFTSALKAPIWHLLPSFTTSFYRAKRQRYNSVVLLIHEGLGDLASIAAAIKDLSREHRQVYVVVRKEYFDAVSIVFNFGNNVKNISAIEGKTKGYRISADQLRELERYGHVIKVGSYDGDPIFRYPDSFYIKLGCNPSLAKTRFPFDVEKHGDISIKTFLDRIGSRFIFVANETSSGNLSVDDLDLLRPSSTIVAFRSDVVVRGNQKVYDISKLEQKDFSRSLLNSLYACYLAERVVVSDAGLFNILVRLENEIDIRVIWRGHSHSLNKEIYGKYIKS